MTRRLIAPLGLAALLAACGDAPPTSPRADALDLGGPRRALAVDENYDCTGTVSGSFTNVFVPAGQTCTLQNATVSGSILAREGARLFVSGTRVDGNIDGVEARVVQVRGGTVGGSIQIADGQSPAALGAAVLGTRLTQGNITVLKMRTGSIRIEDAILEQGNIQLDENSVATALAIVRNTVAQNVQVFKTEGAGSKAVRNNRIGQIVQCKENALPFIGGPNLAGDRQDQCF